MAADVRYIKLIILKTRDVSSLLQFSEFGFYDSSYNRYSFPVGVVISSTLAGNSGEGIDKVIDNSVDTKYCADGWNGFCTIKIDLGEGNTINSDDYPYYRYYTANDSVARDPVSWILLISADDITYTVADEVADESITTDRKALAGTWGWETSDPGKILPCVADTYSYRGDDTSTHGSSDMFSILGYDPYFGIPFLKFDLSALDGIPSENITKAELKFCYYGHQDSDPTYTIKRVLADWSESTLTWANQPSRSASYLSCAALSGYGLKSHDILDLVKEWVDGTYENYGLALEYSSTGWRQNSYIYSKEHSIGLAPYVYVEYTEGSAPTVTRRFAQII